VGARGIAQVITLGLAVFALAGMVQRVVVDVRSRRDAHRERALLAFAGALRAEPRRYGGLLVHAGVVLVAAAIGASAGYTTRSEVRLGQGESATVSGYTLTYLRREVVTTGQKTTIKAEVRVARGGRDLGAYAPAISTFPNSAGGIGTPSVHTGLLRDLYLTLLSSPNEGRIALGVAVNPLVLWLWVGGALMGFGVLVALVPGRRPQRLDVDHAHLHAGPVT